MDNFTITNAKIWIDGEIVEGWINIEDDTISKVSKEGGLKPQGRVLNANGLLVLPGLIDVHVHLRDAELKYKEDFSSGTAAAVAGGYTTILDMPNTSPPVTNPKRLRERIEDCKKKIYSDVGFLVTPSNPREVEALIMEGCAGFKAYMARPLEGKDYSTVESLTELGRFVQPSGKVLAVHAEDPKLIGHLPDDYGSLEHAKARDPIAELSAVSICIEVARVTGARTHICHISTGRAVEALAEARRNGIDISCEATPHHALLSIEGHEGKVFVVEPPLRQEEDRGHVMKAVQDRKIEIIATDHAPHTLEEKYSDRPNPGFPGLESSLPLFMTLVHEGALSMERLLEAMTLAPARRFGLSLVGAIKEGYLASLVFLDPNVEWRIDPSRSFSKARYSPFERRIVKGKVMRTFVRGKEVFSYGELVGKGGEGRPIP